jgi:hypothetical protein
MNKLEEEYSDLSDDTPPADSEIQDEASGFAKMLNKLRSHIRWRIYLVNGNRFIYRKTDAGYYETLTGPENPKDTLRCKMEIRSYFRNVTPSIVENLFNAIMQEEDRLIDGTEFVHARTKGIPFLNGVFDLERGHVRAYRDDDMYCDPIPHHLNSTLNKADIRFFRRCLKEWNEAPNVQWMVDLCAYMLFVHPNVESIWCNPFGVGRNGKSVFISLLEYLMGKSKSIGINLSEINRHSSASFIGKSLIVGRDSDAYVSKKGVSLIKNYSGDRYVTVEPKGGFQYDALVEGKIVVSTNYLIKCSDRSFGWFRRLIPLPFPNTFPQNDAFEQQLYKHVPGILTYLVARAYRYRRRRGPVKTLTRAGNTIVRTYPRLTERIPRDIQVLRLDTQFTNDRVAAFWNLRFFDDDNKPIVDEFLKLHKQKITVAWGTFCQWHRDYFGEDEKIEPGRNTFCGASGGFMEKSSAYFYSERTREGRQLFLHDHVYLDLTKPTEPAQPELSDADDWGRPAVSLNPWA